jgi:hypothetical protein
MSKHKTRRYDLEKHSEEARILVRKARVNATKQDFKNAKDYFKRAADTYLLCKNKEKRNWALAAAGYMSILTREIDEALELFREAAELGYSDLEKVRAISQVRHRGKKLENEKSYREIYSIINRNANPFVISNWNNSTIDYWKWMIFPSKEKLVKLKKHVPGYSKFDDVRKFMKYLNWVNNRFAHDPENRASANNPLVILKESKSKKMFTCIEYAILLTSCLLANGYPARVIAVLKPDYQYGTGKGHWLTEVWSNLLQKWILLDPQNNCFWRYKEKILNAYEIRSLVIKRKTNKLEAVSDMKPKNELKTWLDFYSVIWIYRNQEFFNKWDCHHQIEEISQTPHLLFQNSPRKMFKHHDTKDYLYPKMNQTCFEMNIEKGFVNFRLSNSLVYFNNYEYAFDGKRWKKCEKKIRFRLNEGRNTYFFRARNMCNRYSKLVNLAITKKG